MNKNHFLYAIAMGVLAITAFAYAYDSPTAATNANDGLAVKGWVDMEVVRDGEVVYYYQGPNIITSAGIDFISAQLSGSGGTTTAKYIALSTNAATPGIGDTAVADEITTAAGLGLERAAGTYSHTAADATFAVEHTFTAAGTTEGVQLAGLFATASEDTAPLVAENTFSSVNLISGDQITITWTITIS